jgi:hypothetical protein
MSSVSRSKRVDMNRFQKSYPTLFRRPRYEYLSDPALFYEFGDVCFADSDTITYTFDIPYDSIPTVVLSPINDDVNVWIGSISTTDVTFKASVVTNICVSFQIVCVS